VAQGERAGKSRASAAISRHAFRSKRVEQKDQEDQKEIGGGRGEPRLHLPIFPIFL
jgi:hypothetical protein